MRESRDCLRAKATFVRDALPRKTDSGEVVSRKSMETQQPVASRLAGPGAPGNRSHEERSSERHRHRKVPPKTKHTAHQDHDSSDEEDDTLVSLNLQNPNDALKLLASASSLQYRRLGQPVNRVEHKQIESRGQGHSAATWCQWAPIKSGCLSVQDARILFSL